MSLLRPIALSDHPAHIAVFEAAAMDEAILMASDAFLRDGIQGAVWQASAPSILWEQEIELKAAFRQAGVPCYYDDIVVSINAEASAPHIIFGKRGSSPVAESLLEVERRKVLESLARHFTDVSLEIRHDRKTNAWPHIDGHNHPNPIDANPDRLFSGVPSMRVLCARNIAGTRIEDWQVAVGDYLFLMDNQGVKGKALEHAAPKIVIPEPDLPRILDLYDFKCSRG